MFILGLTGSIATGKSTALTAFAAAGAATASSDDIVHALYAGPAPTQIAARFPGAVRDGRLDRNALGALTLGDAAALADLEAIVHPLVYRALRDFCVTVERQGADLAVLDVPLLYETGFDDLVDAVAVTHCAPATQTARALARPGMTHAKLAAILDRQMPQADKVARADFVIDTDAPLNETATRIQTIVAAIRAGETA